MQHSVIGEWRRNEGYAMLVESGPLGSPAARREIVMFSRIFRGQVPTDELLVIGVSAAAGGPGGAWKMAVHDMSHQPVSLEPVALQLDTRVQAFRAESDGTRVEVAPFVEAARDSLRNAEGADATHPIINNTSPFIILRAPAVSGSFILPYMLPAMVGGEPAATAPGMMLQIGRDGGAPRLLKQSARRADTGDWMVDYRNDGGERFIVNLQFSNRHPLPVWGQVIDSARNEHARFRLIGHTKSFAKSLSFGRVPVVGDPYLLNPELLENAESQWNAGMVDLTAVEVADELARDFGLLKIDARDTPAAGELVPYSYELFAVGPQVTSGEKSKINNNKSGVAPRGAIGTFLAARYEDPGSRARYEAWLVPGADERALETDAAITHRESVGKLLLRMILGNATSGLLADRGINLRLDHNWFKLAMARAAQEPARLASPEEVKNNPKSKNNKKGGAAPPPPAAPSGHRGSDAILLRRESDFAPVALVFYRMSDDLRTPVPFVTSKLETGGPASVVRRSLLERAKDFFLPGGFTAFTTKKGSSFLLTRSQEEGTVIDKIDRRPCTLELLEEKEMPREPWKLAWDLKENKNGLWGTPVSLAIGRNRHGDARISRDGIVRRTEGEEIVAYEYWEPELPWWSEAMVAYPKQGVGVRFRPLVHARLPEPDADANNNNEADLLPFLPPPPPPQPRGNPKTPTPPPAKPKPKPQPEKPSTPAPAPPPVTGGPKTGG